LQGSLFLFSRARGEQAHLPKTIAPTAEVNKNALNSGINADRTMPNTAPIGLLVQIICENGMEKKSVDRTVTLKFINKCFPTYGNCRKTIAEVMKLVVENSDKS
jgi:hypothetical protein